MSAVFLSQSNALQLADGSLRCLHEWPLPATARRRGTVLIVHGLGEHAGRYAHVARCLNQAGFAVRGYDHYGHGASPGRRGRLLGSEQLLDDLAEVIDRTRSTMADDEPLVLLAHSMGGLVAAALVARDLRRLDGLVLSSPALATGMTGFQRMLASLLMKVAPGIAIGNGLKPEYISHDPDEVAAYRTDPLGHDRISGRLAHFIDAFGPPVIAAASRWSVPTLLLYAGADRLVDADGSRRFAAAAPDEVVSVREFAGLYHELFNELDRQPVFDALHDWLDARFA